MKTKAPYWQRVLHEIVQSPNGLTARQLHETFGSSHESSVSESLLRLFRDGRIVREKSVDKRTYRYFIPVMQPSVSNEDMLSVESSTTSSDEHLQPEEEMQLAEDSTIESFQSEIDGLETDEEDKPYPEPARSRRKRLRACFTKLAKGHLVPGYDGSDASLWTLAGFPAGSRISNAVVDELRSSVERKLSAPISRELPSPGSASTDSDSLLLPSFLEGTVRAPTDTVISSFRVLATSSSRSSDQKILKPEASAQLAQRTWSAPEERPTKKPRFDGPELPVATSKGTQSQEKPDKNTTKIVQHPLPPTWKSNPLDEVLGSISRLISDAREPPLNAPLTIQRHSSLSSELGEKMNGQKCMSRRPSTPPRKSDSSVPEVPQIPGRQTRVKFADPCVIEAPKMSTLRPSAPKKSILKKTPSSTGYLGKSAIHIYRFFVTNHINMCVRASLTIPCMHIHFWFQSALIIHILLSVLRPLAVFQRSNLEHSNRTPEQQRSPAPMSRATLVSGSMKLGRRVRICYTHMQSKGNSCSFRRDLCPLSAEDPSSEQYREAWRRSFLSHFFGRRGVYGIFAFRLPRRRQVWGLSQLRDLQRAPSMA